MEKVHRSVHIHGSGGVRALDLLPADRVDRRRQLHFVAVAEADAAVVERVRHTRHEPIVVTDLVGAKRLLIFANA